jgi:hypothetical protein
MAELLDYTGPMARLVVQPHPFSTQREECVLYPGTTIQSMHDQLGYCGSHALVWIDGKPILSAEWEQVYPLPGSLVTMRIIPQGSGNTGKDVLRIVAMVGVMALAIGASILLPPLLPAFLSGAAPAIGALAGIGVTIGGSTKILSLIPATSSPQLIGDR